MDEGGADQSRIMDLRPVARTWINRSRTLYGLWTEYTEFIFPRNSIVCAQFAICSIRALLFLYPSFRAFDVDNFILHANRILYFNVIYATYGTTDTPVFVELSHRVTLVDS